MKKKDMVRRAHRTELEKRARDCKENVWALVELAALGAKDAEFDLYETAAWLTGSLTYLCKKNPAQFSAIAQKELSWPVMYGPHPESRERTDGLIKKLGVGAQTGLNLASGKKAFSWLTVPANVVALRLYRLAKSLPQQPGRSWAPDAYPALVACDLHLGDERCEKLKEWRQRGAGKSLPRLSKQTARQWADAGRELFKIVYPGNFEQHPDLQGLMLSVERHAKTLERKPGGAGIIRAAMLRKVKQAWNSIAALD